MSSQAEWAHDVITALDSRTPEVIRLATLASVAVRIEPHLIRRLRLNLLPDADVGTEADLWFSPLVESRGADAVVFGDAIVKQLWLRLIKDACRDDAIDLTLRAHETSPPALLLEERLTALALTRGHAALPEIDKLLEPAVEALRVSDERALEVARWMHRAAGRLHKIVLQSERLAILRAVSAIRLKRVHVSTVAEIGAEQFAEAATLLSPAMLAKSVAVGVAFDGEHVEFREATAAPHELSIPDTTPRLVSVAWGEGPGGHQHVIEATPGQILTLDRFERAVTLTALTGDRYELTFERPPADVFISYSSQHRTEATALAGELERRYGSSGVWWKQSLEERAGFESEARAAMGLARAVVVIWPSHTNASDRAYDEATRAVSAAKLVSVRGSNVRVEDIPKPFNSYPFVDAQDRTRVVAAIAEVAEGTATPGSKVAERVSKEDTPHEFGRDYEQEQEERRAAEERMANAPTKKTCFVVMGFGEKTDFQSNPQRVLNLNRTYDDIIEPAVTAAGLECIRADKIIHSTVIDRPMYKNLLEADLVIADLSTSHANAIYELGVRHALRPHATIVIAEDKFTFPFDLNHITILKYRHMGQEIGYAEVMRMRSVLGERIVSILTRPEVDSPVFLFLPQLLGSKAPPPVATSEPQKDDKGLAELRELFQQEKKRVKKSTDWRAVLEVLNRIQNLTGNDPYIIQQRALATYKSEYPGVLSSLNAARDILSELKPDTSSDAETVGIWGAIHKRLWNVTNDRADLDKAIRSYGRGYFIKDDYYNAINFAFLLNVRASISQGDEAIADRVMARRMRGEVLALVNQALTAEGLRDDDKFWINATKVEALRGLGRLDEADALFQQMTAGFDKDDWRVKTMTDQLQALAALNP